MTACWIGLKGHDPAAVLQTLGWVETGDIDFDGGSPVSYLMCGDWLILFASQSEEELLPPERLAAFSMSGEVICCRAYENILFSKAVGYRDGEQVWSVEHEPEKPTDFEVSGSPPPELAMVRADCERRQASEDAEEHVDYLYDVPLTLTARLCGFHPLEGWSASTSCLLEVEPIAHGREAEIQAHRRQQTEAFTVRVRTELFDAAVLMGFESVLARPEFLRMFRFGACGAFVRLRGERIDSLDFSWSIQYGQPRVRMTFYDREQPGTVAGERHVAQAPVPKRSFMDVLMGRRETFPEAVEREIFNAKALLAEVDRRLREGPQATSMDQ